VSSRSRTVPNRRSRSYLPALVATLMATAAGLGCSANVGAGDPVASGAQRLAIVDVRLHSAATSGVEMPPRLDASARFVAVREGGSADDALELLGLSYREPTAGTCSLADADATARPLPAVRVDLRDLSPVSVEVRGEEEGDTSVLPLEPRAFPDVGGLVSGVFFVAPVPRSTRTAPHAVTLSVSGARLGELEIPELPRVQIPSAVAVDDAYGVDGAGVDVFVAGAADTRLSVDVVRAGVTRARCGVDASGKIHLDATALGGAGEVTLVVRQQRRAVRDDATVGSLDARVARELELRLVAR
jgi:hypothetical protein